MKRTIFSFFSNVYYCKGHSVAYHLLAKHFQMSVIIMPYALDPDLILIWSSQS